MADRVLVHHATTAYADSLARNPDYLAWLRRNPAFGVQQRAAEGRRLTPAADSSSTRLPGAHHGLVPGDRVTQHQPDARHGCEPGGTGYL